MGFSQGFTAVGPRLVNVDGVQSTIGLARNQDALVGAPESMVAVGGSETFVVSSPATSASVGGGPGAAGAGIGVTVGVTP